MKYFWSVWLCFSFIIGKAQNNVPSCCADPHSTFCQDEAKEYAERFSKITADPSFGAAPRSTEEARAAFEAIKVATGERYDAFFREIESYRDWIKDTARLKESCFMFFVDENTGRWVAQGMAVTDKTKDYSSEFCRGFRFQAEVGMGIKDIGRPTESFLGSLGGMLTFTFAPRNSVLADAGREECNGRFRIGLGLTESYVDQTGVLQALVRMEYKLKDLKDPLFTLGNIKAIVQGALGIDKNYDAIAVGVGAEISVIGFNLLVGIGDAEMHSMIQTSLVYHF